MKRSIFFILITVFASCGKVETPPDDLYSIDSKIISGRSTTTKLSEIAESVEYIRLETRADVLIGMYPQVKIVDSLVVVYSHESGLFVFDSRTGRFKYKIPGFRDRGPHGYSGSNAPMTIDENGRIILQQWDRLGVWDYRTGEKLDHTLPLPPLKYQKAYFLNDTLLVGANITYIGPNTTSVIDAISFRDGSTVHEYGFMEKTEMNPNISSALAVAICEYDGWINCTHFVHDYIYGIDKATLEIEPRFVLNLGGRLKANVTPVADGEPEEFMAVSAMCETDKYLFLQFCEPKKETIHLVYYDKAERTTFFVDSYNYRTEGTSPHGFVDDLTGGVSFFPHFATSDNRAYHVMQAVDVVAGIGVERAAELDISENDNPVIVIAKLKK